MSLHRSLKTKPTALNLHRNVLTRAERIAKLSETEKFVADKNSPFGIVKVASRMVTTGKKPKKEAGEEGADGAAAPAAGAKGAAAKPAAKPAGGKK